MLMRNMGNIKTRKEEHNMAEPDYTMDSGVRDTGCFKEAVCIDAMRIYDSCSEKQLPSYRFLNKY